MNNVTLKSYPEMFGVHPDACLSNPTGYVIEVSQSPLPINSPKNINLIIPNKMNTDKFGQINNLHLNAMGAEPIPTLPVTPTPPREPKGVGQPTILPAPEEKEPEPEPAPAPTVKKGDAANIIYYVIGGVVGGAAGYFVSNKYGKNIYGGILLGGGIAAGAMWVYFNRAMIQEKISGGKKPAQAGKNFYGATGVRPVCPCGYSPDGGCSPCSRTY